MNILLYIESIVCERFRASFMEKFKRFHVKKEHNKKQKDDYPSLGWKI